MYPRNYHPDTSCPYGCDFDCGHFREEQPDQYHDSDVDDFVPEHYDDVEGRPTYPGPSSDVAVWVTGSGERLRLVDMSDLHLARALAKTIEHEDITHPRAKAILVELRRRSMPPEEAPRIALCLLVGDAEIGA